MQDFASSRYSRQVRFAPIGEEGQRKLRAASAAIVGCGALGSVIAEILARAGVGKLVLIDRDTLEESNLQRQFLYDTGDVREGLPKVEAAKRRLAAVNPEVEIVAHNESLRAENAERLLAGAQVLLDGTDNFPARYLLNDFAVANDIPWVYGAAVSSHGLTMTILPRETACLRCVFPEPPPEGSSPTCASAGVLASVTATIGAIEAVEAIKILTGHPERASRELLSVDLWQGPIHALHPERRTDCPSCGETAKTSTPMTTSFSPGSPRNISAESLCGRNAVQISPIESGACELAAEGERLAKLAEIVSQNKFLLRFKGEGLEASLFPDGRVIVWETTDVEQACAFFHRYFPKG